MLGGEEVVWGRGRRVPGRCSMSLNSASSSVFVLSPTKFCRHEDLEHGNTTQSTGGGETADRGKESLVTPNSRDPRYSDPDTATACVQCHPDQEMTPHCFE
ncbi:hypothetical protein E2C01_006328 [Portunus trituberculatus]|uniref:Uncharacterized protein n=1 Tax=Portunus trituberculatus TaxID=210409 RepID=A0A5B7CW32_PORTR|nr:hypothetical protein [Portunus trituberculatus]